MERTKLGISVGLFGAALYFLGLINIIPVVLLAGYTLLFEQNAWLRKTAAKAVGIVVFFAVISALIGIVSNAQGLLLDVFSLVNVSIDLYWLSNILSICRTCVSFAQSLLLIMLGFRALMLVNVKFGFVDNTIDKHM